MCRSTEKVSAHNSRYEEMRWILTKNDHIAHAADKTIKLEAMVVLMSLNSCFVPIFSETKIRVPSERTTRSRGEIIKANGNLESSVYGYWCEAKVILLTLDTR